MYSLAAHRHLYNQIQIVLKCFRSITGALLLLRTNLELISMSSLRVWTLQTKTAALNTTVIRQINIITNIFPQGCTHPNTYEPVVGVLADVIPLLELPVIDPTQSLAFPMTVVALLPYMLLHYEDANELCVRAACHIAQVFIIYVRNTGTFYENKHMHVNNGTRRFPSSYKILRYA